MMRRGFQLVQEMTWYYGWSGQDRSMWLEDREEEKQMDARLARKRAEAAAAAAAEPPLSPEDSFAQRSSASASSVSESGRLAGSDSNSDAFDTPGKRSASENSWVM